MRKERNEIENGLNYLLKIYLKINPKFALQSTYTLIYTSIRAVQNERKHCTNMIAATKCKWIWFLFCWFCKNGKWLGGVTKYQIICRLLHFTWMFFFVVHYNECEWKMTHSNEISVRCPFQVNSIRNVIILRGDCMDSFNRIKLN